MLNSQSPLTLQLPMFRCLLQGQTSINLLGLTDPADEVIRILRNVSMYFLIDMRQHPVTLEPPYTGLLSAPTGLMPVPVAAHSKA